MSVCGANRPKQQDFVGERSEPLLLDRLLTLLSHITAAGQRKCVAVYHVDNECVCVYVGRGGGGGNLQPTRLE